MLEALIYIFFFFKTFKNRKNGGGGRPHLGGGLYPLGGIQISLLTIEGPMIVACRLVISSMTHRHYCHRCHHYHRHH